MNSTSAKDNFALVSKVLNLDLSPSSTGQRWHVNIDELEIVITPDASGKKLRVSHDLGVMSKCSKAGAKVPASALKQLVPSEVGSVVCDSTSKALSICNSLDVSDGNDCTLSVLLPRFVKACTAFRQHLAKQAMAPGTPALPILKMRQPAHIAPTPHLIKKRCQIALCQIEKSPTNDNSSN